MQFPAPPRGIKAVPWRLPIWIYRLGFGWLLGNKFLLLTHQGRKTGTTRQAVLEVIQSSPEDGRYLVVSGFGKRSHWYQNVIQNPQVSIQVGSKTMKAEAKQLDPIQSGEIMLEYAQKYPRNLRSLANILGYNIEHTPEGYREFGRNIPVIQFSTKSPDGK